MFRIIDSFNVTEKQINGQNLRLMDKGSWFVLSPDQQEKNLPLLFDHIAKITKPDGSIIFVEVVNSQIHHSVLAVQFKDITKADLPRLSKVEVEMK